MRRAIYRSGLILVAVTLGLCLPLAASGQQVGDSIYSFNSVLDKLFDEMLPLSGRLMDVGRAIGGFAALSYISLRVWKHIAAAEAIDFFPLLRPFAIGMAIVLFPQVIALMNGTLKPLEAGTRAMAGDSHKAIYEHIHQREQSVKDVPTDAIYPGAAPNTDKYEHPDGTSEEGGFFSGLSSAFSWFGIKRFAMTFFNELLHILYSAASLCINVIRTFYLLILAIIGPIAFGLSIFDGFQNTLSNWFARYIHVYLWVPIANVFGAICSKILENMLILDQGFFSTVNYIIFLVIAVVGYTTIPSVAGYIVQAGGNDSLLGKVSNMTRQVAAAAAKMV